MAKMNTSRSHQLFQEAKQYLPGGVDSPVRAFAAVGGEPLFISHGKGSKIYDADGNEFIDYVCSWGALVLGHAHPDVVAALKSALDKGTSFGASTELETVLAKLIIGAMPWIEMMRFVNSGTEATMSAQRLARAFTQRDKVIKFSGGYHGHADGLLVRAGSGLATLGIPDSPGVPQSYARDTLVAPYNDLSAVERLFETFPKEIAAIIVEPVAANMGVVPPRPGFLEGLRQLSRDFSALLIFDEVITGFRISYGGATAVFGVVPDLVCLGKIIGGGLPVGAYGGRREIMEMLAPLGPVYQAGTLSGNPLAMTAGIETLRLLAEPGAYQQLEERGAFLAQGIREAAQRTNTTLRINRVGSAMTVFFASRDVVDYSTAQSADTSLYASYFHQMQERGVYLTPSQFEASFISLAHTEEDIKTTIKATEEAFSAV